MNKAFTRLGVLAATAVMAIIAAGVVLPRIAKAQVSGARAPKLAVLGCPMELGQEPGQRVQTTVVFYGPGQGAVQCSTVFDFQLDTMGPAGSHLVRKTVIVPHMLDVSGRMSRVAAVQSGDNWDIYLDGVMVQPQCITGLPPGEPVIGTRVLSHSTIFDPIDEARCAMGATTQVFDSAGKSSVFGKSHELSGHVMLMK
jgi:hypothetical protein